jgi:hypothetical protein
VMGVIFVTQHINSIKGKPRASSGLRWKTVLYLWYWRSFGLWKKREKILGIKVQSSNSPFNPPNRPTDQRNAR